MGKIKSILLGILIALLLPSAIWASSSNSVSRCAAVALGEPVGSVYVDSAKTQVAVSGESYNPVYLKITPQTGIESDSSIIIKVENGYFDDAVYSRPVYTSAAGNSYDSMMNKLEGGMTVRDVLFENLGDKGAELPYKVTWQKNSVMQVELFPIDVADCHVTNSSVSYTMPYYYIPLHIISSSVGYIRIEIDANVSNVSGGYGYEIAYASDRTMAYPVQGGNLYYNTDGRIVACDSTVTSAVIPANIGGVEIEYVKTAAFENCKALKEVTVQEGIKSIGDYVFYGCSALENVSIANTVTAIGGNAFAGCTSLNNIVIPNTVTELIPNTFRGCTSLTDIKLPYGMKKLYGSVFRDCTNLSEVHIPASVTVMLGEVFEGCDMEKLTLYVTEGSRAQVWARENGVNYVINGSVGFGDTDGNGMLTASDCVYIIQKVLDSSFTTPVENNPDLDFTALWDVNMDGKLSATDAAGILQKSLDSSYIMECEK